MGGFDKSPQQLLGKLLAHVLPSQAGCDTALFKGDVMLHLHCGGQITSGKLNRA